jgi:hypothetical protein
MHCWCPPATGPGQPHEIGCFHYTRPAKPVPVTYAGVSKYKGHFFGHGLPYQAKLSDTTLQAKAYAMSIECTCAASGVIGHAAFCSAGRRDRAGADKMIESTDKPTDRWSQAYPPPFPRLCHLLFLLRLPHPCRFLHRLLPRDVKIYRRLAK